MTKAEPEFRFGHPKVPPTATECCGKPKACTNTHLGCAWRRKHLLDAERAAA